MNAAKRLGDRRGMFVGAVGVLLLLTVKPAWADLPLPHTATANSSNALLRLTNTNGGPSAFGFLGTGTYGFVGNSTVIGGAGVRGSFFDAATGAPRASGNLGRSTGGNAYYGVWGRLFSGGSPTGAAVYGLSESRVGVAGAFEVTNSENVNWGVSVRSVGQGPAFIAENRNPGPLATAGLFQILNLTSSARCIDAFHAGQGDGVVSEHFGQGNGVLSTHLGSSGNAGAFLIQNANNPSFALVAGTTGTGMACFCANDSLVDGDLEVTGGLTPSAAALKIDHPLDPGNRYLQLPAVHSSEMTNLFKGVILLDQNGEALVELPEWFEAANGEFTYHLTPIGAPAPGLYVAQEIENNTFQIAGGSAGLKVSWLVTAVRQDPYAVQHPIVVEADKPADEVGLYRHPEAYGLPEAYRLRYDEHAGAYQADSTDGEGVGEASERGVVEEE